MTDAIAWIGASDPEDKLDFAVITKRLPPEAGILVGLLGSVRIKRLLAIRREPSDAAAKAQKQFRQLSLAAVVAGAVAALTSGLLLYGAGSGDQAPVEPVVKFVTDHRTPIVIIQILALFVSAVATGVLSALRLVDTWVDNRNKAELLRRNLFNEVLTEAQLLEPAPLAAAKEGNAIVQALEFFRRYQHELQIEFYKTRGKQHTQTAVKLTWITAALSAIAGISGLLGGLGGTALVISAFLGIAVPILLSAAQSWRAMGRDGDKAASYKKAGDALGGLLDELRMVRAKAALADATAVHAYFDRVHEVMTTESEAWKENATAKP